MVDRELCVQAADRAICYLRLHIFVTSDAHQAAVANAPPVQYENPVDVVNRLEDSALDDYAAEMRAVLEVIGTRRAMGENDDPYR